MLRAAGANQLQAQGAPVIRDLSNACAFLVRGNAIAAPTEQSVGIDLSQRQ